MRYTLTFIITVLLGLAFWFLSKSYIDYKKSSSVKVLNSKQIKIAEKLKLRILMGQKIYEAKCSSCHMEDGSGVQGVFPPLANSDWLKKDVKLQAISTVKNGKSGLITVKGVNYNGVMPAQDLSDAQIANVMTYVYNSWGNDRTIVTEADVKAVTKDTFSGMKKSKIK